jgi:outer membrane receptor protein involved in Fe transport
MIRPCSGWTLTVGIASLWPMATLADEAPAKAPIEEIRVIGRTRPAPVASSELVRDGADLALRPYTSPGQLLEVVPGLITGQHAGGGKADQILLRGFDADHGTDVALSVGDIPVNMRSHAHGQGYADMHFVIPETLERLEVFKGPYDARIGDFGTAGAIRLATKTSVPENLLKVEVGAFDQLRGVALFSPKSGVFDEQTGPARALVAVEGYWTDGPFDSPENLGRFNAFAGTEWALGDATQLSGWLSYYRGDWNASGQVPQRGVDLRLDDRFGTFDGSEGGQSNRTNALVRMTRDLGDDSHLEVVAWASLYELDLFSNFTLFLDDPELGDGIVQRDSRFLYGGRVELVRPLARSGAVLTTGVETRWDDAHVRTGKQRDRDAVPGGLSLRNDVFEVSWAGYAQVELELAPWARWISGVRLEEFRFEVRDRSGEDQPEGRDRDLLLLPKANLILTPFSDEGILPSAYSALRELSIFFNYGQGYHSNDARSVVADPREEALPRAVGYELGIKTRLLDRLDLSASLFWLDLQSEFVFVGDAGDTEARGRAERRGLEVSVRLPITPWLSWDADLAFSRAEFTRDGKVPQTPRSVVSSGLAAELGEDFGMELRARHLGKRYGTESRGGPELRGYTVWDAGMHYRRGRYELTLKLENVFDTDYESAQFIYESRLPGEPDEGVRDRHFTPGNPRNLRAAVTYYF